MDAYVVLIDPETGAITMTDGNLCVARSQIQTVGKHNRWAMNLCGQPVATVIGGAGFCERHRTYALEWHKSQSRADRAAELKAQEYEALKRKWKEDAARATTATSLAATGPHIVYYVRRELDGLIKIGTSSRFTQRLSTLRGEHGALQVLLTHCGDREREKLLHKRFAASRVTGEWFRPDEPLISWILEVRKRRLNKRDLLPGTVPLDVMLDIAASATVAA
jgi:Meiotically Up-regulated Gene 113 (MUG113) protein